jgi:hypothetical protein
VSDVAGLVGEELVSLEPVLRRHLSELGLQRVVA